MTVARMRTTVLFRTVVASALACVVVSAGCTPAGPAAPDADPVVIVGGTGAPAEFYQPLASRLRAGGYEVYVYTIPSPFSRFENSAATFAAYLDDLLDTTGASRADLIGHSQGVILMRYAARFLGSGDRIDTMVTLSGGIHGSQLAGDLQEAADCLGIVICTQAATGSEFITALNSPQDTIAGIHHVNITTIHEQIAIPYTTNLMTGPGDVTNVVVQDQCPTNQVEHALLAVDGAVASAIDDALAKRAITLDCSAL